MTEFYSVGRFNLRIAMDITILSTIQRNCSVMTDGNIAVECKSSLGTINKYVA